MSDEPRPAVVGSQTTRTVTQKFCAECKCSILSAACKAGCKFDFDYCRPPGSVITRTYERTDILLSEEVVGAA